MTTQEMITEVFQSAGKPSNMQIYTSPNDETTFDLTLAGSQKILAYLNQAIVRIANWKFGDGRILRFRELFTRTMLNVALPAVQDVIAGTTSTVEIAGFATNVSGQFNGWIMEITAGIGVGEKRLITASTAGASSITLSVNSPFTIAPDATSKIQLYHAFFKMVPSVSSPYEAYHFVVDPVRKVNDIMKVRDVTSFIDLTSTFHDDLMTSTLVQTGTPTTYKQYGNELWFDVAPSAARSYEVLYTKNPALLTTASQVPELPEIYHEAAILWTLHNVQRRYQDLDGAYASKRELEDLMNQLRMQGSMNNEYESIGLTLWG